jgi:deoxyribonuclease IV
VLFGAHCSGGIKKALDNAVAMNADAVQLFVQSPRTWRFPNHDPKDLERFRVLREEAGLPALVHSLYLVNLAAPDDAVYSKSVDTMRATVDTACAIDADAVVFHVGSHLGAGFEAGLERVVPALEQVLERCNDRTWVLMENSAGAGGTIGRSVDELAVIFDALDRHERLGICLDSCHWYVSGIDVAARAALEEALHEVDDRIGLDRLRALHANDAKESLGSNRDRHDNIGDGVMGEGLGVFLAHPELQHLPVVLEVPGRDGHGPNAEEIQKLRDLHARATT